MSNVLDVLEREEVVDALMPWLLGECLTEPKNWQRLILGARYDKPVPDACVTHDELNLALRWLTENKMLRKATGGYRTTRRGKQWHTELALAAHDAAGVGNNA